MHSLPPDKCVLLSYTFAKILTANFSNFVKQFFCFSCPWRRRCEQPLKLTWNTKWQFFSRVSRQLPESRLYKSSLPFLQLKNIDASWSSLSFTATLQVSNHHKVAIFLVCPVNCPKADYTNNCLLYCNFLRMLTLLDLPYYSLLLYNLATITKLQYFLCVLSTAWKPIVQIIAAFRAT